MTPRKSKYIIITQYRRRSIRLGLFETVWLTGIQHELFPDYEDWCIYVKGIL